jgi:hypothetical protein
LSEGFGLYPAVSQDEECFGFSFVVVVVVVVPSLDCWVEKSV